MAGGLKRDLGLPATTAIAIGAMVGSGIFILPGLAFMEIGAAGHESVVMAFVLAGLLVLPAAFSASEMATAMPEDGGSYIYVERSMGPLWGTIAGIGNWFMLSFKGALALIGGVPYLVYALPAIQEINVPIFGDPIIPLALFLALLFIVLNLVSTSGTGSLQFVIVAVMLITMTWFVLDGFTGIEPTNVEAAFSVGEAGFLGATALVFISYAGVIKVAAVAEEVKDPGRVIPQAMVGSLVITSAIYVAIVYVAIGLIDVSALTTQGAEFASESEAYANGLLDADGEGPIMAIAADQVINPWGGVAVTIAALMALASTANAGLLSGSRFPFAMARDNLAPAAFAQISERFNTPVVAVGVTGAMLLGMIAFLPIDQVAKLGSAFQILVFILVNLALVGFREGAVDGYNPEFTSPLYPWMQIFGMLGGLVVLSQIGLLPIAAAIGITVVSAVYYYGYAREQVDREGAAQDAVRQLGVNAAERTRELFESPAEYDVLVALTDQTSPQARSDMLRMATDLGRLRSTVVSVVEFFKAPHRVFSEDHPDVGNEVPEWLATDGEKQPEWLPADANVSPPRRTSGGTQTQSPAGQTTDIEYRRIDSEDYKHSVVDFASYEDIDLLLLERTPGSLPRRIAGSDTDWILENAPCDVALIEDRGFDGAETIAVVTTNSRYDPVKLLIADAIAEETGATIELLQAHTSKAAEDMATIKEYHDELAAILTVQTESTIVETDAGVAGLTEAAQSADLLVTELNRVTLSNRFTNDPHNKLVDSVDATALLVQPHDVENQGFLHAALMKYVFRN